MPKDWVGSAIFGSGGRYRYVLRRKFMLGEKTLTFIMLNPSTATAEESDPTVRRCEGYARAWGFRELTVLNIFALRSTDPKKLYTEIDPVGPENNERIVSECLQSALTICAWGVHSMHMGRGREVLKMVEFCQPHYLKLTKDGIPMHPLYLKADLKPQPFPPKRSILLEEKS